jgi:hypothetical protein
MMVVSRESSVPLHTHQCLLMIRPGTMSNVESAARAYSSIDPTFQQEETPSYTPLPAEGRRLHCCFPNEDAEFGKTGDEARTSM